MDMWLPAAGASLCSRAPLSRKVPWIYLKRQMNTKKISPISLPQDLVNGEATDRDLCEPINNVLLCLHLEHFQIVPCILIMYVLYYKSCMQPQSRTPIFPNGNLNDLAMLTKHGLYREASIWVHPAVRSSGGNKTQRRCYLVGLECFVPLKVKQAADLKFPARSYKSQEQLHPAGFRVWIFMVSIWNPDNYK